MKFAKVTILILLFFAVSCQIDDADIPCFTSLDCPEGFICSAEGICIPEESGDTGNTGNSGNTGDTGDIGDTGNSGNSGDSGNTGDTGNSGDSGNSGNTGDSGNSGTDEDDSDLSDTSDQSEISDDLDLTDMDVEDNEVTDEAADETIDETVDEVPDETVDETVDEAPDEVSDDDTALPPAGVIVEYLFQFSTSGWTHEAVDGYAGMSNWPYDTWDWTMPFEGPSSCHTDSACWVTDMKNYINCQRAALYSPTIDLSFYSGGQRDVTFSFWQWYSFWSDGSYKDGGVVQASTDGSTWTTLVCDDTNSGPFDIKGSSGISFSCNTSTSWEIEGEVGYSGSSTSWTNPSCVVPASLCAATTKFRFLFSSGIQKNTFSEDPDDYNYPGWAIDDIVVRAD